MEGWEERVNIFSVLPVATGRATLLWVSCSLFLLIAQSRASVEPAEMGVREDADDAPCGDVETVACAGSLYTLETRTARTSMLILDDEATLRFRRQCERL